MRVVVAGAEGLLGRYAVARLRRSSHDVLGLSRTGAEGHAPTDYSVGSLVELLQGAEAVVDLAATGPGRGAWLDLTSTVVSGANLLEASRLAGVRSLVQASSVSVYDPDAPRPLTEGSLTRPRTPYGLAKLTVERWARLDDYDEIRTVSLRLSNVVGAHDDGEDLVSTYLRLAAEGADLPVPEPLGPARDLLWVHDAARAIEAAVVDETAGGAFNVAGAQLLTPAQLAQAVSEVVGGRVVGGDPAWRHEPPRPTSEEIDTDRAREVLDFSPTSDVRAALGAIREELGADRLSGAS